MSFLFGRTLAQGTPCKYRLIDAGIHAVIRVLFPRVDASGKTQIKCRPVVVVFCDCRSVFRPRLLTSRHSEAGGHQWGNDIISEIKQQWVHVDDTHIPKTRSYQHDGLRNHGPASASGASCFFCSRSLDVQLANGHAGNDDRGAPVVDGVDSDAAAQAPAVLFSHDLFSSGSGGRGDDKHRLTAAIKAFLACSTEVMAHLERRVLERRLEGRDAGAAAGGGWVGVGGGRGRNKGWGARDGIPFQQTGESVGGVLVSSVSSQKAWKSLLCQLVKNLEWAVGAGSSLCVT